MKVDNAGYDQKIKQAQRSLEQFGIKGTEVGQKMSGLGRALSMNIGQISKMSVGLGAAAAAMKIAGDAFKHNEELMDDWNGTVEGAKAVYDSFLTSLNTGDFSGFFSRMGAVAAAAREAYEALDNLGTFNAFNQINLGKARTGLTEALAGYRTGDTDKEGVLAAADRLKKELSDRQEKEFNAYMKAIESKATVAGVDSDMLKQLMQGSYGDYEAVKATQLPTKSVYNSTTRSFVDEYDMAAATPLQKLGQMLRQLTDEELQNLQALGAQAENTATEIANVDKQTARVLSAERKTKTTTTKEEKPKALEGSIDAQQEKVRALRAEWTAAAGDDARAAIKTQLDEANAELERMLGKVKEVQQVVPTAFEKAASALAAAKSAYLKGETGKDPYADANAAMNLQGLVDKNALEGINIPIGVEVTDEEWQALVEKINEQLTALDLPPIELDVKTGNIATIGQQVQDVGKDAVTAGHNFQMAASAVSSLSGAIGQMEDPAAKIAGIIGQAIASIALTFATSLKGTVTPWDWIAAAAAGTATMISTIAAVKSATEYHAGGGLAGMGSVFTPRGNDTVPAMLSPGEEVLPETSWRHQKNIGRYLQGSARQSGGGNAQPYVSGEHIWLGLNNYLQRTGRGELVTSRR